MKRKTLAKELIYKGIGLHKGENIDMKLVPQTSGGIVFKRVDLDEGKNIINVAVENTFDLTRGTNLRNEHGAAIYTIEHFLSALYILNITDLLIEIEGNELPIADGSAIEFVKAIEEAGVADLEEDVKPIIIKEPIYVTVGDKHVVALPYDGYKITYSIRFEHTFLKSQMAEYEIDLETYKREIAPARTFGFDYEIEYLKKNGLALGGTLDNAIVVTKDGVLNPQGLRFEDEFVKHKMLDIIGDLKVINRPIQGHIIAVKAGHAINAEIAKKLNTL
ncbi:MAG: UDP-3-O-acyl-N-acetylglucosamine deacetylase [Fusobacteriaceae bacterium]